MDFFEDLVGKCERRYVKHGIADVETRHSTQRRQERRNVTTRAVTVGAGGKRVVVTHVPAAPRSLSCAGREPCSFVHCVTSTHSAGKIIGRGGVNLKPLCQRGVYIRVDDRPDAGGAQCIVEGNDEKRVQQTLARFRSLLESLA